jgi:hypothetical protein
MDATAPISHCTALGAALGFTVAWLIATVRSGIQLSGGEAGWELRAAELRDEVQAGREWELAASRKTMERTCLGREQLLGTELEERRDRLLARAINQARLVNSQVDLESRLARCHAALAVRAGDLDRALERVEELEQLARTRGSANQELSATWHCGRRRLPRSRYA